MSDLGWTVAVDAFLSARDLAPTTRRSYRQTLDHVGGLLGSDRHLRDLDPRDVARSRSLAAVLPPRSGTVHRLLRPDAAPAALLVNR